MRIDGLSSRSYPVKRKPRKAIARVDDNDDGIEGEAEFIAQEAPRARSSSNTLPARQQDMIFPRSMSTRVAHALTSYLTTSSFVEWDMEVLGLDVHI
ncbi:hypothetical protein [Pseudomonas sp. MWU16-30317]|uniref:hypothetical protein n=1 Tax=Pseudomonas sp. MWU16-30317 TaxID=2878095 RepID=UPI001CFBB46B|nr:hypothetical protein [Pseudomonas sp. MWU16-30317]